MPTNSVTPLRIIRAAWMVIISSAVYVSSGTRGRSFQAALEFREILSPEHMPVDPCLETVALPGDVVPSFVERVVALVITLRIGGERAALHFAHRAQDPRRQHH